MLTPGHPTPSDVKSSITPCRLRIWCREGTTLGPCLHPVVFHDEPFRAHVDRNEMVVDVVGTDKPERVLGYDGSYVSIQTDVRPACGCIGIKRYIIDCMVDTWPEDRLSDCPAFVVMTVTPAVCWMIRGLTAGG
jgi:hypothetical protein